MKKNIKNGILILVIVFFGNKSFAQQQMENSMSQYFQNRILWNAAYTGMDSNKVYALHNRSWVGFDGAPVMTGLSGEMNFGKNSALGVQWISDQSGILLRSFGIINYSFKAQFTEAKSLRLGIALTAGSDRLNTKYIDADGMSDALIANNVNSKTVFDANFGMVYCANQFELGLSIFRIANNLKGGNDIGNLALAQLGASYNFRLNGDDRLNLRPLTMLRYYRTTQAVFDVGMQFDYDRLINVMLLYQSTGNIRAGFGLRKSRLGEANIFYNSNTKLATSSSQQYELGLALYLKNR